MAMTRIIRSPYHVLLIDDDRVQADHIRSELSERADLQVHVVADVVKAIRFLTKQDGFMHAPTPEFVLLNLELPYYPGTALLHERRCRPSLRGIPVIAFSAVPADALNCLSLGANAHVVKPETPAAWRPLLHELLARHLPALTPP